MSKEKETESKDNPAKDISIPSLPTKTTRQDEKENFTKRTEKLLIHGKRL